LINLSNAPQARDGLPAVSPDGDWVAFVSDREGRWGIWVTPRTGGEALKVADLSSINTTLNPWGDGNRAWQLERISWGP
jgi:Tol biopolymer transport system component